MKYLGIICLALVISIGVIGTGYSGYQQDLTVNGTVIFGDWSSADFSSVDVSRAPDCTLESQAAKTLTIKYHSKDNNRHDYSGYVICPLKNYGTVPVVVDTVEVTIIGPERDPDSANLSAIPIGNMIAERHTQLNAGESLFAGLYLSGGTGDKDGPYKGDYYITVVYTTKVFTG